MQRTAFRYHPPTKIHFVDENGRFRLFGYAYATKKSFDPVTLRPSWVEDENKAYPISVFVRGDEYKFFGLFTAKMHLFGIKSDEARLFLFGTESLGRDIFSRVIHASRISLSIGLVGVFIGFGSDFRILRRFY